MQKAVLFLLCYYMLPAGASNSGHNDWLGDTNSRFLRTHAGNTIDWHPWSVEIFSIARQENKPVFVSIGQQSCSWCHVMNREVFSDSQIGEFMNKHFINVLIDSEASPEVSLVFEDIYNKTKGIAAFPMNVWLTPEGVPFLAKYFLDSNRGSGREKMMAVADYVAKQWKDNTSFVQSRARTIKRFMKKKAEH